MRVLVLGDAEVHELLPIADAVDVMVDALTALERGEMSMPLRTLLRPERGAGLMALMPAHRSVPEPVFGLKEVCVFGSNAARGLDSHQGTVLLHDGETGELKAVMNASAITAIRTAAVSGVATRLLARQDAHELAILGTGVQARSHLVAMAAVRQLTRARVWGPSSAHLDEFVESMGPNCPFRVEAVESAEAAVRNAEIVVTATSAKEPVLDRRWLSDGTHINAVGSSIASTRELDTETVADASLFVDRRESTLNESGDFLMAAREADLSPSHIRAELGEVLVGNAPGRTSDEELTVFKSLGLAVEDLATAEALYARATTSETGQWVRF